MKFSALEKLVLIRCEGAESVFAQLSKPHLRPTKLKILRWMDDDKSQNHTLEAFEGFLEGMTGLEILSIWIGHMDRLPKVRSIIQHKKTLVSLAITSREHRDNIFTYSEEDFNQLCTECTELQQLSVMFPELCCEDSLPAVEFKNFCVRVTYPIVKSSPLPYNRLTWDL